MGWGADSFARNAAAAIRRARGMGPRWHGVMVVVSVAHRRARCVYSPNSFFRLDFDVFRCAARSLGGQNAWRASSYML